MTVESLEVCKGKIRGTVTKQTVSAARVVALIEAHRREFLDGCQEFHHATEDEAQKSLADFESEVSV